METRRTPVSEFSHSPESINNAPLIKPSTEALIESDASIQTTCLIKSAQCLGNLHLNSPLDPGSNRVLR